MKLIVLAVFLCMVINFDTCLGTADGNTIFKRATQQRILKAGEKLYKRLSPYLLIICGETDEDTGLMYIVDDAHMGYIYQHDELRRFLKNPKKFLPSTRIIYAGRILYPEEIEKFLINPKQYWPDTRMIFAGIKKKAERKGFIAYIIHSCKKY